MRTASATEARDLRPLELEEHGGAVRMHGCGQARLEARLSLRLRCRDQLQYLEVARERAGVLAVLEATVAGLLGLERRGVRVRVPIVFKLHRIALGHVAHALCLPKLVLGH